MNPEDVNKLTDEELRIKVAELNGYEYNGVCAYHKDGGVFTLHGEPEDIEGGAWGDSIPALPDYLNDLNACHEFEERFITTDDDPDHLVMWESYLHNLCRVCRPWHIVNATAKQRCKAFVLTMTEDVGSENHRDNISSVVGSSGIEPVFNKGYIRNKH